MTALASRAVSLNGCAQGSREERCLSAVYAHPLLCLCLGPGGGLVWRYMHLGAHGQVTPKELGGQGSPCVRRAVVGFLGCSANPCML